MILQNAKEHTKIIRHLQLNIVNHNASSTYILLHCTKRQDIGGGKYDGSREGKHGWTG